MIYLKVNLFICILESKEGPLLMNWSFILKYLPLVMMILCNYLNNYHYIYISLMFLDCQRHLVDPELQLVYPCAKLLQAAAASCPEASAIITHKLIPLLLEQFNKLTMVSSFLPLP